MDNLKPAIAGQYHAAMDMLKEAIEACPEEMWAGGAPPDIQWRSFWRLSYHTLFFTRFYLEVQMNDFVLWEKHRDEAESDQERERLDATPYTKAEILEYWDIVDSGIDAQIAKIDLTSPESGFPWYKIPKLDHVLMNLRHIQEHAGGLRDRLLEAGIDQKWYTKR